MEILDNLRDVADAMIPYEELPKAVDEMFKHFSVRKVDVIKITRRV